MPCTAAANPPNKQAFSNYFGRFLHTQLDSCATCHVRAEANGAESLDDFPHNSFGDRLRIIGEKLAKENPESDFQDRLNLIADEDTDGDGVSNLNELLAGTQPGQSDDYPDEKSLQELAGRLKEFREFVNRYPWRPFQPVSRPDVPSVPKIDWTRNPIDHFIAARHESRNLTPQQPAAPEVLLRRVYLDLTGLAPSPKQIREFMAIYPSNPKAYEDIVDQLLNDPAYGERWGRHWMDIWRYSDWAGYRAELRESQRHIWHWRDWIIEALNDDKPYDRMLVEMLAADEVAPLDADALRATGFLARNFFRNRDQWMDNVVTHTSQGFMGITVGCAKCHDHMYDPISQRDYYAMRAIFERYTVRTDRVPGVLDTAEDAIPRAYDNSLTANTWLLEQGDERRPVKDDPILPGTPASLGGSYTVEQISLPLLAWKPDQRETVKRDLTAQAEKAIANANSDLALKLAENNLVILKAQFEIESMENSGEKDSAAWKTAATQLVKLQRDSALLESRLKIESATQAITNAEASLAKAKQDKNKAAESKANKSLQSEKKKLAAANKSLATAEKSLDEKIDTKYKPRMQDVFPDKSNGRRLAFARWLTARQNPLTARVAVNHIWLRHFGQAIVPTVNDFGGNGRKPTHPALLDWLADEFMARNWSMKQIHRLIVTSATYRMSSLPSSDNAEIDPDNKYLWRMPNRRMEGEIVRDNLLHISGRLDKTMGGPDIDNMLAQESKRRSVYLRHAHEKLAEFVQIFDGPGVSECYIRENSVKPHQALALINSPLTFQGSRQLAKQLHESTNGHPAAFVEEAYLKILARFPNEEEANICLAFLRSKTVGTKDSVSLASCEKLITVLFNHNDFITIR